MEAEKLRVLREHKASLVFSLGNGFQVRNLLLSCRPSRYSKPTRLLTGACSRRMASSVTLRAIQGIQISLLCHPRHMSIWKVPDKFFDRAALQRLHERSNTAFRLDRMVGGYGRNIAQQATFFSLVNPLQDKNQRDPIKKKDVRQLRRKHTNNHHSALHGCDLYMAQTVGLVLHQTQKKTVDCGPATFRQNVRSW